MDLQDTRTGTARSDEEDERFFLTGRTEIVFALQELIHRGEMMTVSFNHGADMILTTLLSVQKSDRSLVFDWGGSEEADRKLLRSPRSIFIAKPDGIKVQFASGAIRETRFGDHKAFVTDLPERIVRLQRRESFRVLTPFARPLLASLDVDGQANTLALPVHDLSVDGLALTLHAQSGIFETGLLLRGLRVELPDFGEINCTADVRHVSLLDNLSANPALRVGLRFQHLPHVMQARIQRYIVGIERARRSMTPD